MKDSTKQTLTSFVEKARRLQSSRYLQFIYENKGLDLTMTLSDDEENIKIEQTRPDDEALDAFILTFRFFIQRRERISLRSLEQVLEDPELSETWKQKFTTLRSYINKYLDEYPDPDSFMQVDKSTKTRREIMEVFIYGSLAHENEDKKLVLDEWKRVPLAYRFYLYEFEFTLINVLRWIDSISYWSEQELNLET